MLITALLASTIGLYLASTALIARYIRSANAGNTDTNNTISKAFVLGWLATLLHLVYAYLFSFSSGILNFSLSSMVVLVSGLICLIYVLGGLSLPIRRLGIIVFPLTVLCLLFSQLWSNEFVTLSSSNAAADNSASSKQSMLASAHVVIAILAYCLLAIAAIQALLYVYQERQLKRRASPAMLMALPPLQTMEQLLFRLIWTGFMLLTLTLVSGGAFSHEIFGKPFEFKHHTILAALGWLVFAVLLIKRHAQGLRGSQAVYWTVGGFVLIQLGYFGTKIVSETLAVQ